MRRNPADFGDVSSGDETAAINAALDAIRQDKTGILELTGRLWSVDRINATDCPRLVIEAEHGAIIRGNLQSANARGPIIDLSKSPESTMEGGFIWGGADDDPWVNSTNSPPANCPTTGLLISSADKYRVVDTRVWGHFSGGAISVISAFSVKLDKVQAIQRSNVSWFGMISPCLIISGKRDWGVESPFQTLTEKGYVNDIAIQDSEIHAYIPTKAEADADQYASGFAAYLRDANHVRFQGEHMDCSGEAHVLQQGACSHVRFVDYKFYTESGRKPQSVFRVDGSSDFMRVRDCEPNPLSLACTGPVFSGSGSTPNLVVA